VEPADPLSDDQPVAICLRDHLPKLTVLTIADRQEADIVLTIRKAKLAGDTSRNLLNFLGLAHLEASANGVKLWDGYQNLTADSKLEMLPASTVPCAVADALIGQLRKAMQKARDQKPKKSVSLKSPALLYVSAVSADYITTYRNLNIPGGGTEYFPVGDWLTHHPKTMLGMSGISELAAWSIAHHFLSEHRHFERIALYAGAGVRFAFAAHNHFLGRSTCHVAVPLSCPGI
jgi:hypothetical protein